MIGAPSHRPAVVAASSADAAARIGLPFAQHGAQVYLASVWNEADADAAQAMYAKAGAAAPVLIAANFDSERGWGAIFDQVTVEHDQPYAVIVDVDVPAGRGLALDGLTRDGLDAVLDAAAWSVFGALQAARAAIGHSPRYTIAVSVGGSSPGSIAPGQSGADAAQAMLEIMCRFMVARLAEADSRINVIRVAAEKTSGRIADAIGDVAFALSSGRFDAMSGQVIAIDQANVAVETTAKEEMRSVPSNLRALGLRHDLEGKPALITGGTKGIGLAAGLALGRLGAQVYLTHRWGSADENEIIDRFREAGALEPVIVEADASHDHDTIELMQAIGRDHGELEILVSNVAFAHRSSKTEDLSLRALRRSVSYTAWPLISYLKAAKECIGAYPRYVIGVSSSGVSGYIPAYEYVAASKAILETLARHASLELKHDDVRVNIVRAWCADTESLQATFGPDFGAFVESEFGPGGLLRPEEVGDAIAGLCSGWMDCIRGEVVVIDRGFVFWDSVGRRYDQRNASETPKKPASAKRRTRQRNKK